MGKRLILALLLASSLSMVGCVVINNGEEDKNASGSNNTKPETVTKEVIVKEDSSNTYTPSSDYIFYDSNSRYLSTSDLQDLTKWELKIARNEIYARHGRLFKDKSLQKYFDSCSWYYGSISSDNFSESSLNDMEAENIKFIQKYE